MKNIEIILKALANRRRLAIIIYLKRNGESYVGDIADAIHVSFKATSKHLIILDKADILEKDQRGKQMFYKLASSQSKLVRQIIGSL